MSRVNMSKVDLPDKEKRNKNRTKLSWFNKNF